ncbi:hypothetical protein LSTR_LSTR000585 [Laodelphax striatellus]|uniref:Neurotransmitter-gated ion-channel ligand-binding domain-containing protein n=1 Tax=Laodelphax striatellus TaxID=195883 RepID=A0A482XFS6_LAOST|nr:hypothetical protein LSTR_LSTR000585 [Laodelphax striatellus]
MNGMVSYLYKIVLTIIINDFSGFVGGDSNCETELIPRLLLRCNLLENYINRPVQAISTKVHVNTTIFPIDMDFQDNMQSLEVTLWMNMTWKDENLGWNPNDASNIKSIFVECDDIWTPVLSSLDRRKVDDDYEGVICELSYNGVVKRMVTKTFENTCYNGLDFRLWPFDEHQCSVFLGVPQTTNLDIEFIVQEFEMHAFGRDTAWVVDVMKPPPVIHPVKRFELQFNLKRPRLVQGTIIIFTTMVNYCFFLIILSTYNIIWTICGRILLKLNVKSERITTAVEKISASSVFRLIMFDSENKIHVTTEIAEDEEAPTSPLKTTSFSHWKELVKLIDRIVLLIATIGVVFLKVLYFPHLSEYKLDYKMFNNQDSSLLK